MNSIANSIIHRDIGLEHLSDEEYSEYVAYKMKQFEDMVKENEKGRVDKISASK